MIAVALLAATVAITLSAEWYLSCRDQQGNELGGWCREQPSLLADATVTLTVPGAGTRTGLQLFGGGSQVAV